MKIELIQGDASVIYKFQRKNLEGQAIETKCEKMWFTVKKSTIDDEPVIQKTLDDGITFDSNDFFYRFQIDEEDSEKLQIREYGFDIAIINEAGEKKTILNNGILKILDHYTKKENEV